jgi:hypothetical protein
MMFGSVLVALSALAGTALGHMEMTNPPPLGSSFNPHTTQAQLDYDMKSPLGVPGGMGQFPCRGHLNLLGTDAGASVATWPTGSTQSLSIGGSAWHNGGSCQAMLSFDQGNSWKVIKSWIGNCPTQAGGTFSFVVPGDTPTGTAVFAWSWFNRSGNREMYHNCAAITVTGGGGSASVPFNSRPAPFIANVAGSACTTIEGGDVMFPNPGPDVENTSSSTNQPGGDCGGGAPAPEVPASTAGPEVPATTAGPEIPASSAGVPEASATHSLPGTDDLHVNPSGVFSSAEVPAPTEPGQVAPPAATSTKPRKCKRYRKRSHPRRMMRH